MSNIKKRVEANYASLTRVKIFEFKQNMLMTRCREKPIIADIPDVQVRWRMAGYSRVVCNRAYSIEYKWSGGQTRVSNYNSSWMSGDILYSFLDNTSTELYYHRTLFKTSISANFLYDNGSLWQSVETAPPAGLEEWRSQLDARVQFVIVRLCSVGTRQINWGYSFMNKTRVWIDSLSLKRRLGRRWLLLQKQLLCLREVIIVHFAEILMVFIHCAPGQTESTEMWILTERQCEWKCVAACSESLSSPLPVT